MIPTNTFPLFTSVQYKDHVLQKEEMRFFKNEHRGFNELPKSISDTSFCC